MPAVQRRINILWCASNTLLICNSAVDRHSLQLRAAQMSNPKPHWNHVLARTPLVLTFTKVFATG